MNQEGVELLIGRLETIYNNGYPTEHLVEEIYKATIAILEHIKNEQRYRE